MDKNDEFLASAREREAAKLLVSPSTREVGSMDVKEIIKHLKADLEK